MHTLLRFTVLGIFVAAGIGIAISVAAHVEPASTPADEQITFGGTQPSPPIKELPSTDSSAEKHKPSMPKTVFPERLDNNVVAQPAPYRDPVAEQIDFLARRLNQIEQTATSKQIDFLEQ
ncbi:MAG: hypothetical protein IH991_10125, partial [Planctomycetes bacterium]|nr:hypothetical protein [Planctomycetota bacterium]